MKLPKTLWAIGGIAVILASFGAGIFLGYHEGVFRSASRDHYFANFYGAPLPPASQDATGAFLFHGTDSHGAFGKVVDIGSSTISVVEDGDEEISVSVPDGVEVIEDANEIPAANISVGDVVAVIGAPNESGQVEARFIRVLKSAQ